MQTKAKKAQEVSESDVAQKSEASGADLQFQSDFTKLLKDLEGLYNEQVTLYCLARYTGRILRQPSVVSPEPLEIPRAREMAPLPERIIPKLDVDAFLKGTLPKEKFDYMPTWEAYVGTPDSAKLPLVQTQCGTDHWSELEEAANLVKDAILRLIKPEVEPIDLLDYLKAKPNFETIVRSADAVDPFPSRTVEEEELVEVKVSDWSQNLDWLIMLVKLVASQCRVMSDFGHARESHSAAKAAHMGVLLRQRADSLSQMLAIFDAHLERYPEDVLSPGALKRIGKLLQKMEDDPEKTGLYFSAVSIADIIGKSPDTVRACIKEMMKMKTGGIEKQELSYKEPSNKKRRLRMVFNTDEAVKIARYCTERKRKK